MEQAMKEKNPLIRKHRDGTFKGYPLPNDYPNFDEFLKAHRIWLNELRLENAEATYKLLSGMRREKDSQVKAYLSAIIHLRKEYARFLTNGIEGCDRVLGTFEF